MLAPTEYWLHIIIWLGGIIIAFWLYDKYLESTKNIAIISVNGHRNNNNLENIANLEHVNVGGYEKRKASVNGKQECKCLL